MKEKKKTKYLYGSIILLLIIVTILVLLTITVSFIVYKKALQDDNSNVITTSSVSMTYTEDNNGISITNALPTADDTGKKLNGDGEYFDFTVKTTIPNNTDISYEIAAIKNPKSTINDNNIRLYLEKQVSGSYVEVMKPTNFTPIKSKSNIGSPIGSMVLLNLKKNSSAVDNFRLRMWLDQDANVESGKTYMVKVNVYGRTL